MILIRSRQQLLDSNITVDSIRLENVNTFIYLGCKITSEKYHGHKLLCNSPSQAGVFQKKKNRSPQFITKT